MEALVAGIQKVELVGGESWLQHNIGAIVVFVAAAIAATVAIWNQGRQLAHDRHLRNQERMRDTLDATISFTSVTHQRVTRFRLAVAAVEASREENQRVADSAEARGSDPDEEQKKLKELEAALREELVKERELVVPRIEELEASRTRLSIRVEPDDPILLAYAQFQEATAGLALALVGGMDENRTKEARAADTELDKKFKDTYKAFVIACRSKFT